MMEKENYSEKKKNAGGCSWWNLVVVVAIALVFILLEEASSWLFWSNDNDIDIVNKKKQTNQYNTIKHDLVG